MNDKNSSGGKLADTFLLTQSMTNTVAKLIDRAQVSRLPPAKEY